MLEASAYPGGVSAAARGGLVLECCLREEGCEVGWDEMGWDGREGEGSSGVGVREVWCGVCCAFQGS